MQALVAAALLAAAAQKQPKPQLCAVPLVNVLKRGGPPVDRIFKVVPRPSADPHFVVALPAPSCDDVR